MRVPPGGRSTLLVSRLPPGGSFWSRGCMGSTAVSGRAGAARGCARPR